MRAPIQARRERVIGFVLSGTFDLSQLEPMSSFYIRSNEYWFVISLVPNHPMVKRRLAIDKRAVGLSIRDSIVLGMRTQLP